MAQRADEPGSEARYVKKPLRMMHAHILQLRADPDERQPATNGGTMTECQCLPLNARRAPAKGSVMYPMPSFDAAIREPYREFGYRFRSFRKPPSTPWSVPIESWLLVA